MTQRIGILDSTSAATLGDQYAAFQRGLKEIGYVDGENVTIEFKFAENDYKRLDGLAARLVKDDDVAVIVAAGGPVSADRAAAAAAGEKAIVFTSVTDAVANRLRKGKNVTGIAGKTSELDPARLKLLSRLLPTAREIGVLINKNRPTRKEEAKALQAAVSKLELKRTLKLVPREAGTPREIDSVLGKLGDVDGLLVTADPFFNSRRSQLVELAKDLKLPTIYQWREFATAGGLMSYGPGIGRAYHQAGIYAGLILKGTKPAQLPVVEASGFELVINLKTANALDIGIPPTLLEEADELIE
jgi:putative ABC transport system substrate-binding protein